MKVTLRISVITLLLAGSALFLNSCKEDPVPPTVTTAGVSSITRTTASSGGNVTADGGAEVTARGVCWNISENPTVSNNKTSDGTGTGSFTSSLTGLTPGTPYFVRAYATNEAGTTYGNPQSFTTSPVLLATVTTAEITSITETTAVSGGNITDDGGGTVTARGVCWSSTSQTPTVSDSKTEDGSGKGIFISNITGLKPGTTYNVRAYAENSAGIQYGPVKSFPTEQIKTVTDIDGNVYNIVTIGDQQWLQENLKTTRYRNGDPIPANLNDNDWDNTLSGAYAIYPHELIDGVNSAAEVLSAYGALYNWHTVSDARGLCPVGWQVPTDTEWTTMENYLIFNGYNYDGSIGGNRIAKSLGSLSGWASSTNEYAIGSTYYPEKRNASGFTALPGGYRWDNGSFGIIYYQGRWWTSTENDSNSAWQRFLSFADYASVRVHHDKNVGISVRCLKD